MATATTTMAGTAAAAAILINPQTLLSTAKLAFSISSCCHIIPKKKKPINNLPSLISFSTGRHNYHLHKSFCASANPSADAIATTGAGEGGGGGADVTSEDTSTSTSIGKIKDAGNLLDIRVGRIIKAWMHEEANSLYVEQVDVGEAEPRIICSGLVKRIPLHHLQDRNVVVLANLKPRNMRGIKSSGMLMAASDASHDNVELLRPPHNSVPGDRIWFGSPDDQTNLPDPATPNQIQKKKIWESVQPYLRTDDSCIAILGGEHFMRTSAGDAINLASLTQTSSRELADGQWQLLAMAAADGCSKLENPSAKLGMDNFLLYKEAHTVALHRSEVSRFYRLCSQPQGILSMSPLGVSYLEAKEFCWPLRTARPTVM